MERQRRGHVTLKETEKNHKKLIILAFRADLSLVYYYRAVQEENVFFGSTALE